MVKSTFYEVSRLADFNKVSGVYVNADPCSDSHARMRL